MWKHLSFEIDNFQIIPNLSNFKLHMKLATEGGTTIAMGKQPTTT